MTAREPIEDVVIRSAPQPNCPLCGGPGDPRHEELRDRLFGAPGRWSFRGCSNPECGALWLDPMPLAEDMPLAYRRYYTHSTSEGSGRLRPLYEAVRRGYYGRRFGYPIRDPLGARRLASRVFDAMPERRETLDLSVLLLPPPMRGGRCLEIGCGAGTRLEILAALGWSPVGVDLDPVAVAAAKARGLDVRAGTLEQQRFPDHAFNAVVSHHVIEHVRGPLRLLEECRRVLEPGGRLVMVTPNAGSLGHRRFGGAWRGLEPPRHLQIFTPRALVRAAREAGFEAIDTRTIARMARVIHVESSSPENPRAGWSGRTRAFAFAIEERGALRRDPDAGEEIVLEARARLGA